MGAGELDWGCEGRVRTYWKEEMLVVAALVLMVVVLVVWSAAPSHNYLVVRTLSPCRTPIPTPHTSPRPNTHDPTHDSTDYRPHPSQDIQNCRHTASHTPRKPVAEKTEHSTIIKNINQIRPSAS